MNTRHFLLPGTTFLSLILGGCASPPAEQAIFGNPYPLINLVQSGQVAPNERLLASNLPGDTDNTITPLCALIGTVAGAAAVELLLTRGADVNQSCNSGSDTLPLDIVIETAALRGAIDSPFRVNKQYRPEHIPTYLGYADRLLGLGGRSKTGPMTTVEVRKRIREAIEASDRLIPDQVQSYNDIVESRNSLLRGIGVVAGTVVAAKVLSDKGSLASAVQPASRVAPSFAGEGRASGSVAQPSPDSIDKSTTQSEKKSSSRKTYPFNDAKTYASEGIGTYTRLDALQSLQHQRKTLEGTLMGHAPEWRVVQQDEPVCTQHGRSFGGNSKDYWRCTMKVTYTGLSWLDQGNTNSSNGTGVTR